MNPEINPFWVIDFPLYEPDGDGKSKLDHVHDMLSHVVRYKGFPFRAVLMNTCYATRQIMILIESLNRFYYCPLKSHRQMAGFGHIGAYQRVDSLEWNEHEQAAGKIIKIRNFPKIHEVKWFRMVVSPHRTDFVVTNDLSQDSTSGTQTVCSWCWKAEPFHRETRQITGLERCQCRKARIQRNHIACAFLVWTRLAQLARKTSQTLYRIKHGLPDDDLRRQLKKPSIIMRFA